MKKFAVVMAVAMLVCVFASCAQKKQDFTSINDYIAPSTTHNIETGTLSFKNIGGEYAAITDYVGSYKNHTVIIPGAVGDKERGERIVTEIGNEAFYYTTAATSIVIPDTVTSIGDWAFAGCTSLETIVIPASVTSIGKGAFTGCTSLKSVVFEGEEITSIADYTFKGCTSLESINIPESVKSIGIMAFDGCTAFDTEGALKLSASIESIGKFAFSGISKAYISAPEGSYAAEYIATQMSDNSTEAESTTTAE